MPCWSVELLCGRTYTTLPSRKLQNRVRPASGLSGLSGSGRLSRFRPTSLEARVKTCHTTLPHTATAVRSQTTSAMRLLKRLVRSSAPTLRPGATTLSGYGATTAAKRSLDRAFSSSAAGSGGTAAFVYDFENLVEMQEKSCREFQNRKLFGTKIGKEFSWMTFGEFATEVTIPASSLPHLPPSPPSLR
jgi:hypothetical protein